MRKSSIDVASVSAYLTGKRVLVTGAGGSIGSQLCRSILDLRPIRLIMLDHNENALHALQLSLEGKALLTSPGLVLCDIRDEEAVRTVFETTHPQVVFHAAAHKHVTFLERFPSEGHKTNVERITERPRCCRGVRCRDVRQHQHGQGSRSHQRAREDQASRRDPHRPDATARASGRYMSVRFGNVLGSSGSVIPTFISQIENGDPITVTDPDATRYFMTIEEAVLLVLQAGALGPAVTYSSSTWGSR